MSKYDQNNFDDKLKAKIKGINIEVPDSLRKSITNTLENLPEKSNKEVKRRFNRISGITAIILVGFLGFNMVMPVYAERLPVIGPTFKSINSFLGVGDKYVSGAKDINISKSYDDTTMTIKNVYYDGVELAVAYEIKCDSGFKETPVIFPLIKKGFKYLNYDNELHKGEFVDEKTYVGLSSYVFNDEEFFHKGNINLIINDIYGEWQGYYPEKLKFNLYLDSENMDKKTYKINKEFKYEENDFEISNIIVSPFNTIVQSTLTNNIRKNKDKVNKELDYQQYDLSFKAVDNNGMPLEFEMGKLNTDKKLFHKKNCFNSIWRFAGVNKDINSITIIPILDKNNITEENSGELNYKLNKNDQTIIKLDNKEEYIVENVVFNENETIVYVKVKKYLYNIKSPDMYFLDEHKEKIETINIKFNDIDDGYKFTMILPKLDKNKDHYVAISKNDSNKITLENEKIILKLNENQ